MAQTLLTDCIQGDLLDGTVDGLGTTVGGPVGKGVSNLGKGTGNLAAGVTTGVGDGVTELGKGDVLGSLGAIGGGVGRGVGGLATGLAGYGRNSKDDNTLFGVDIGEQIGKLRGEAKYQEKGNDAS